MWPFGELDRARAPQMRRIGDFKFARLNRASRADFMGDVHLTSSRSDKDSEGAGVNISLAVAGVVAAGVGLLTMHTAFTPLPKPGVPVVIATSRPAPTRAAWRHAEEAAQPPADVQSQRADGENAAPALRARPAAIIARHHAARPAAADPAPTPAMTPIVAKAAAPASKPPVREVAAADLPGQKMCKAPSPQPQLLSAKSLQPALVLRYDAKARQIDIPPPQPAADEQRRLKLSALLANMLTN